MAMSDNYTLFNYSCTNPPPTICHIFATVVVFIPSVAARWNKKMKYHGIARNSTKNHTLKLSSCIPIGLVASCSYFKRSSVNWPESVLESIFEIGVVGVDFSKSESKSESTLVKTSRLRSPGLNHKKDKIFLNTMMYILYPEYLD